MTFSYEWVSEYCFTSLSVQSLKYCDKRKPEVGTISYSHLMTSMVLYSALYHSQRCRLQAFELFRAPYMHNLDADIRRDRDSNTVPLRFEPQPDWMSHRGRPSHVKPVLCWCWNIICDAGTTLNQNWCNVSCSLSRRWVKSTTHSIKRKTLFQWRFSVGVNVSCLLRSTTTRHWSNTGSLLVQRLRHWPSIDPALDEYFLFVEISLTGYNSPFDVHLHNHHVPLCVFSSGFRSRKWWSLHPGLLTLSDPGLLTLNP